METLFQDIRYGLRMLRRGPAFTTVAVLTLALGIGANTAIFSLINALLLRMLPVKAPDQLVVIGDPTQVGRRSSGTPQVDIFSYPLYRDLRDHTSTFSGMLASGEVHRLEVATDGSEITSNSVGVLVSGNYFSVLGVNALVGRVLSPQDDDAKGKHPVAVVSYDFWTRKLSRNPNIVGQTVQLNHYPYTIVGVTPPGFFGDTVGEPQDFWVPMMMQEQMFPGRSFLETPNVSWLLVLARLKPGFSARQGRADVNLALQQFVKGPIGQSLASDDREELRKSSMEVSPGGRGFSSLRHNFYGPLVLLMTVVGLVLLIACINVANLLLARAAGRHKEIAVRLAMGARRLRLVRQLLTESMLLAFAGGACGLVVAYWGTRLLLIVSLGSTGAENLDAHSDLRVLGFTAGVCILTGLLFGSVPALRSVRVAVGPALKNNSQSSLGGNASRWNWGKILVVSQVAVSLLVLFVAGLLVRTMQNLRNLDLGYNREHLLLLRTDPISAGYKGPRQIAYAEEMSHRLSALPGVRAVTYSKNGLFSGSDSGDDLRIEGFIPRSDEDRGAHWDWVGPGYFSALGIPLILGRDIGPEDTAASPKVAVINETMARFYFGKANPLGRRFWIDDDQNRNTPIEIVGVARDARGLDMREQMERRFYMPFVQTNQAAMANVVFEVRSAGNPAGLADSARKAIADFDANIRAEFVRTMNDLVERAISNEILVAKLSTFFSLLALLLACVGLYGIMSYTVGNRTKEIGLRMALGAQRSSVLWLVLVQAGMLVVIGVVLGIPLAFLGSHFSSSMLFGLKTTDPLSMAVAVLLLAAVALLACLLPARRATKVDPMVALRYE
ncbi:MAG TPA: ABC transporter permease [Candidatus Angelobacter sp.]|nr:ABC transporter permease [Candidatus Angelobacter sp.]